MKFALQLPIERSCAQVWKAFDSPENMKEWQPSLISSETIRGTQGQPGAVAKLTYKEREREFSLMERVTYREDQHRLDGVYENNFADNTVGNTFVEQGPGQTLWKVETEFKFKTRLMRILGTIMKKIRPTHPARYGAIQGICGETVRRDRGFALLHLYRMAR